MEEVKKKYRCQVCNYFDSLDDCSYCHKCLIVELAKMVNQANVEIFKFGLEKKFFREIN